MALRLSSVCNSRLDCVDAQHEGPHVAAICVNVVFNARLHCVERTRTISHTWFCIVCILWFINTEERTLPPCVHRGPHTAALCVNVMIKMFISRVYTGYSARGACYAHHVVFTSWTVSHRNACLCCVYIVCCTLNKPALIFYAHAIAACRCWVQIVFNLRITTHRDCRPLQIMSRLCLNRC